MSITNADMVAITKKLVDYLNTHPTRRKVNRGAGLYMWDNNSGVVFKSAIDGSIDKVLTLQRRQTDFDEVADIYTVLREIGIDI